MGAKHSKREATVGSPASNGSLSSKVARSRSLPIRGFARSLDGSADGRSFRRRISHDEISLREKLEEHQRLIAGFDKEDRIDEEETVKDNNRFSLFCAGKNHHDVVQNCISPFLDDRKNYRATIQEAAEKNDDENGTAGVGRDAHDEECLTEAVKLAGRVSASSNREGSCEKVVGTQDDDDDDDDDAVCVFPSEPAAVIKTPADNTVETVVENSLISVSKPSSSLERILLEEEEEDVRSERTPESEKEIHAAETSTEGSKESWPEEVGSASDSGAYYQFQAQKKPLASWKGSRLQRQRWKLVFEQGLELTELPSSSGAVTLEEENMAGSKGKLSLSSNSGKRQKDLRRNSFSDGGEFVWGSLPGKRMKDGYAEEERAVPGLSDIHPDAFAWGLMGQSDPFLGFDAAGFLGQQQQHLEIIEDRTKARRGARMPSKSARWRAASRKARGLRASSSPKCVSSLESCLQAQFLDERDRARGSRRVSHPLNFSAVPNGRGKYEDVGMTDDTIVGNPSLTNVRGSDATTGLENGHSGCRTRVIEVRETVDAAAGLIPLPYCQEHSNGHRNDTCISKSEDDRMAVGETTEPTVMPLAGQEEWWKKALSPLTLKKQKTSDGNRVLSTASGRSTKSRDAEDLAIGTLEGLLFSFGVGVGVMSVADTNRSEVEKLSHLLKEAQCQMQELRRELATGGCRMPDDGNEGAQKVQPVLKAVGKEDRRRTMMIPPIASSRDIPRTSAHRDASDEMMASEGCESVRSAVTVGSSLLQGDQMAELEAELEAELDQLTGGDSIVLKRQISVLDEEDLALTGLPAQIEEESDDYSAPAEPIHMNNCAVSPRELTRLLHKLQSTRQEELITELEEELQTAQTRLKAKEKELELWKDCVRRLSEVSLVSALSGDDDTVLARAPIGAKVPVNRPVTRSDTDVEVTSSVKSSLPEESQASFHFSLHNSELQQTHHGESVRGASSHSEKRWTNDDVCDEFLRVTVDGRVEEEVPPPQQNKRAMPSAVDCKSIIEDGEIEKLLVNSVQDLQQQPVVVLAESYSGVESSNMSSLYEYSSGSISLEDGWDNLPITESMGVTGTASWRVKLLAPHPTRRSSFNWEMTTNAKQSEAEVEDEDGSRWQRSEKGGDQSLTTAVTERARLVSSKMMASEMASEGFLDDEKSSDALCLVRNAVKLGPAALDGDNKVALWEEGLTGGETPGLATGSDWECQSCASELEEQQQQQECATALDSSSYASSDAFGEEDNLVREAEEVLGRMLITQIVEKTRRGSLIVQNAQLMLATLEKNEEEAGNSGVGDDACTSRVPQTPVVGREKAGGEEEVLQQSAKQLLHSGNLVAKPEMSRLLTIAEQRAAETEYEFFHRLTSQIKEKKLSESCMKDRPEKEPGRTVRLGMEQIPVLDLGENSQILQEGETSGGRDDILCGAQPAETSSRDIPERGTVEDNSNENWLLHRDDDVHNKELYGGSGFREDEVHARRQL